MMEVVEAGLSRLTLNDGIHNLFLFIFKAILVRPFIPEVKTNQHLI